MTIPKLDPKALRKDYDRLQKNLEIIERNFTKIQLCAPLGISRKTWNRRIKNPENLTYRELRTISRVSGVDFDNLVSGEVKLI